MTRSLLRKCTVGLLMGLPGFAADSLLVVDRGLPQVNLNNASGAARSNVRWSWDEEGGGFVGDSFTIGAAGEHWVIDSIRTWTVPGGAGRQPGELGDFYQDVRLYVGSTGGDLTPVAAGSLTAGSSRSTNPRVHVTESTRGGAALYDDFGTGLRIWQVDFTDLNLAVEGGTSIPFGVWGSGRPMAGNPEKTYRWFNHASNAALSGTPQDGASGLMMLFDAAGRFKGKLNGQGNGWDKNSDVNVQVFAHRVASPGVLSASR